jgi:hypothetical protein
MDIVRGLLDEPGILIDEVDKFGNTPVHLAFINENVGIEDGIKGFARF